MMGGILFSTIDFLTSVQNTHKLSFMKNIGKHSKVVVVVVVCVVFLIF